MRNQKKHLRAKRPRAVRYIKYGGRLYVRSGKRWLDRTGNNIPSKIRDELNKAYWAHMRAQDEKPANQQNQLSTKRQSMAKPAPDRQHASVEGKEYDPDELVTCSYCRISLMAKNLEHHVSRLHLAATRKSKAGDSSHAKKAGANDTYDGVKIRHLPADRARTRQRISSKAGSRSAGIAKQLGEESKRAVENSGETPRLKNLGHRRKKVHKVHSEKGSSTPKRKPRSVWTVQGGLPQ